MQIRQNICGVTVEFLHAPSHQTNTGILFEDGDTKILVKDVYVEKDYEPLFSAIAEKKPHKHGDVEFKWPNDTDMEVSQGDKVITLKELVDRSMSLFSMMAMGRVIDQYYSKNVFTLSPIFFDH